MRNKTANKLIYFIVSIAGIVVFAACGGAKQTTDNSKKDSTSNEISLTPQQVNLMNIHLGKIVKRELSLRIFAPGKVDILSNFRSDVTAKISGTIEKINVFEGQKIQKGQTMMTIASSEFVQLQETYLSAKSELEFLKTDFERQKSLRKENVVGEKDFQLVKSKYETTFSHFHSAEARLKILGLEPDKISSEQSMNPYYEVKAPISGFLYKMPVSLGMSVTPTQILSHIVSLEKYHADLFVYEKDINSVFEGQEATISFTNASLADVKGEVEYISRGIDPVKRTVMVHVAFDPPNGLVLPDMTVRATLVTKTKEQVVIPSSALVQENNNHYLFVSQQTGNKISFKKICIQIITDDEKFLSVIFNEPVSENCMIAETGTLLLEGEMKKGEMKN